MKSVIERPHRHGAGVGPDRSIQLRDTQNHLKVWLALLSTNTAIDESTEHLQIHNEIHYLFLTNQRIHSEFHRKFAETAGIPQLSPLPLLLQKIFTASTTSTTSSTSIIHYSTTWTWSSIPLDLNSTTITNIHNYDKKLEVRLSGLSPLQEGWIVTVLQLHSRLKTLPSRSISDNLSQLCTASLFVFYSVYLFCPFSSWSLLRVLSRYHLIVSLKLHTIIHNTLRHHYP